MSRASSTLDLKPEAPGLKLETLQCKPQTLYTPNPDAGIWNCSPNPKLTLRVLAGIACSAPLHRGFGPHCLRFWDVVTALVVGVKRKAEFRVCLEAQNISNNTTWSLSPLASNDESFAWSIVLKNPEATNN